MGSLRKGYAHKPLTNFTETLAAFLTGISDNFFCWLEENQDVVAQHKANLGFVWG